MAVQTLCHDFATLAAIFDPSQIALDFFYGGILCFGDSPLVSVCSRYCLFFLDPSSPRLLWMTVVCVSLWQKNTSARHAERSEASSKLSYRPVASLPLCVLFLGLLGFLDVRAKNSNLIAKSSCFPLFLF